MRPLIKFDGTIAGQPAVIMLDCGATGNFVADSFLSRHGVETIKRVQQETVALADGSVQHTGGVLRSAAVSVGTFVEKLDFVSLKLSGYDAIFGMSWLYHHNPEVDWRKHTVRIGKRHILQGTQVPGLSTDIKRRLNLVTSKQLTHHLRRGQVDQLIVVRLRGSRRDPNDAREPWLSACSP